MHRFLAASCLLLILKLISATSFSLSASELRTMGNRHFEIVGPDLRSVSRMNHLSMLTVETAARYLEDEGLAFPMPILVSLRPGPYAEHADAYRIRVRERAAAQVDIRWEASLELSTAIQALSEALLTQYTIFNYGRSIDVKIPAWPVASVAEETLIGLRASRFLDSLSDIRGNPPPELLTILKSKLGSRDRAADFGYWLNQCLKSAGVDRATIQRLFRMALAGIEMDQALIVAIQPTAPELAPIDLEVWWQERMSVLLEREYEVVESMEETRIWMSAVSNFDAPIQTEAGVLQVNLRTLWKHRDSEALIELVEARYEILRLRMLRANPAYFNAAHSLGSLFEVLLQDGPSHKFVHALAVFLSDMEDAKAMQEAIQLHLDP
jgi:PIN domain nuclease of toxin-antitoxin system